MMDLNERIRKKPDRYGMAELNLSAHSKSSEPFADNSIDYTTYSPGKRSTQNESSQNDSSLTENGSVVITRDFDRQFEEIDQKSETNWSASKKKHNQMNLLYLIITLNRKICHSKQ